jgi:ParB family transcriptional regulator, chromosome partitioning protein
MDDQTSQEPFRRRLGRGLNALLGSSGMATDGGISGTSDQSDISLELIERNPMQPRKHFEESALIDLSNSIRQHGVLQPLIVRRFGEVYQLIAGERRLIAAKRAGLEQVPCRVIDVPDQGVCEVALEENLKRQDLNVIEKSEAFATYLNLFGCGVEELSRRLSMDRSTLSNFLRLNELPEEIKELVRGDRISGGHARAMLSLDPLQQQQLADRVQKEGLSVRKTEEAVRELLAANSDNGATVPFKKPGKSKPEMTPHVLSLQDQLRGLLGANVEIVLKKKDQGKIVIDFNSNDDFERILGTLRRVA